MNRLASALVSALVGYLVGAGAVYVAVQLFSTNLHDRDLEAAMTAAFVGGPALALVGALGGAIRGGRRPESPTPPSRSGDASCSSTGPRGPAIGLLWT